MTSRTDPEVASDAIEHACKVARRLLSARGCRDPERLIAEALFAAAIGRSGALSPDAIVKPMTPANDHVAIFGEDMED